VWRGNRSPLDRQRCRARQRRDAGAPRVDEGRRLGLRSKCYTSAFMAAVSLEASRRLLANAGYRVLFRTSTWSECYVHREHESWEGRGRTDDEALADALARMLPSHLASSIVARYVASSVEGVCIESDFRTRTRTAASEGRSCPARARHFSRACR
jgi:hypothetical protein